MLKTALGNRLFKMYLLSATARALCPAAALAQDQPATPPATTAGEDAPGGNVAE